MPTVVGFVESGCPFPVGFGGFFQTDPNTIYSGTKWEQKKDVFILASGAAYPAGSTGGEAQHMLTIEEMPNHNHIVQTIYSAGDDGNFNWLNTPNEKGNPNNLSKTGFTSWVGGSKPHNNMPPYYTMPFWIRTA